MSTKVPKSSEYFRKKHRTARLRLHKLINRRRQLPDPEEINILPMRVGLAAQIRKRDYATNAAHIEAFDAIASQVIRATKYTLARSDAASSDDYEDEYEYEIVYYLYGTAEDHNQGAIFVKSDNSLFDLSCLGLGFNRGTIHCGYLSNARNGQSLGQSSYPITRDCIDCDKTLQYPYDVATKTLAKPTVKFCPVFYLNEPNRAHAKFEYSNKSYCFWDEITQDWISADLTPAQCRELLADYDDEYYDDEY